MRLSASERSFHRNISLDLRVIGSFTFFSHFLEAKSLYVLMVSGEVRSYSIVFHAAETLNACCHFVVSLLDKLFFVDY